MCARSTSASPATSGWLLPTTAATASSSSTACVPSSPCTARAAVHGALWTPAVEEPDADAAVVGNSHPEVAGEAEVLRVHIDLARGDLDHALARAEHTLRLAENRNLPELQCEALEIVGRVHRTANLAAAAEAFERGLAVATRNALHLWRARALHEVATVEVFRTCGVRGFQRALEAAHT